MVEATTTCRYRTFTQGRMPAAFVLLSGAYQADADIARSRRWPVLERLGKHLDLVNRSSTITEAILELTS